MPHLRGTYSALLALTAVLVSCRGGPTPIPQAVLARTARALPFFADPKPSPALKLELKAAFNIVLESSGAGDSLGELTAGKFRTPVLARTIGQASRITCRFPKLMLGLPGRKGRHTKAILTGHCNDSSENNGEMPDERHVSGNYLAHRMAQVLGLATLGVKRATISYVDRESGKRIDSRQTLLLEHAEDVARRRVGDAKAYESNIITKRSYRDLDAQAVARLHLFQILINNSDWQLCELQPLQRRFLDKLKGRFLHNVIVIRRPKPSKSLPLPIDLDLASLVGTPAGLATIAGGSYQDALVVVAQPAFAAKKSALHRWMVMRLQYYRRLHPPDVVAAAIAHLRQQRRSLSALLAEDGVSADARERGKQHTDAFFSAVETYAKLPRIAGAKHALYRQAAASKATTICSALPAGLAVQLTGREQGEFVEIRLLQRVAVPLNQKPRLVCAERGETDQPALGWVRRAALGG